MDLLLTITNEHVPQVAISDNNNKPWIDKEVIQMMHKKDRMRKIAKRTGNHTDIENFEEIRRNAEKLIEVKYKDYLNELKSNLTEHPKRFWSFVKISENTEMKIIQKNNTSISEIRKCIRHRRQG
jgi:hypothetical protein